METKEKYGGVCVWCKDRASLIEIAYQASEGIYELQKWSKGCAKIGTSPGGT